MVDEKKVMLMTRLAIYEKQQEKKDLILSKYFKNDYVRYQGLKALVASTLAYWLTVAVVIFMQFEVVLDKINEIDYFKAVYALMLGYTIFAVANMLFANMVYSYRYKHAKNGILKYNKDLKKLIDYYDGGKSGGVVIDNGEFEEDNEERQQQSTDVENNRVTQNRVNRSAILNQREKEVQDEKQRLIKENLKRLKEREEMNKKLEAQRRANYDSVRRKNIQMQNSDNNEGRN